MISPERFATREERNKDHLSAICFKDADDHFKAIDRSIDLLLRKLKGLDRSRLKALEWSLNEITDNVLNHSESVVGGIVQVSTYPKKCCVDFYVCDAGIGIPKSLRQGRPDIPDDARAMRAAIKEGVTRNSLTNQGNGLFGTFKCCEVSGGRFDILSGRISLRYQPGRLTVSTNEIPFRGTFIRASILYAVEKLLERALVFRGRQYDPVTDYVERVYEAEGDTIKFVVKEEIDTFGSRDAGRRARTKVENLINSRRAAITFDFSDVHLISSSFADEVFGKLFHELGPIGFGQLCKFKRVDPTVQKLIDRAIAQRMTQQEGLRW
jgi:uncharacterized protein DUF4325